MRDLLDSRFKFYTTSKVIKNTVLLFSEKIFRILIQLYVFVEIARYLGVAEFGIFSICLTYCSIALSISKLGLENILIKELSYDKEKWNEIIVSALTLRLTSSLFVIFVFFIYSIVSSNQYAYYIFLAALFLMFQVFDVLEYYFLERQNVILIVRSKFLQLLISSLLRLSLIYYNAPLKYFVICIGFDYLYGFFLLLHFDQDKRLLSVLKVRSFFLKDLLKKALPVFLASLCTLIYLRIDILMIEQLLDKRSVGIYSAATKISEFGYFIPVVFSSTFVPQILIAKKTGKENYLVSIRTFFSILIWMGLILSLILFLLSPFIIQFSFGSEFQNSIEILKIHVFATVFVFIGIGVYNYYVIENLQSSYALNTFLGLVLNVILNYFLLRTIGLNGAAIATLVSYFFVAIAANFFHPEGRKFLWILFSSGNPKALIKICRIYKKSFLGSVDSH